METLSDKITDVSLFTPTSTKKIYGVLSLADVKEFIKELKQELRGIPVRESNSGNGDKYQDIIEIWKRIDKLAGDKLI